MVYGEFKRQTEGLKAALEDIKPELKLFWEVMKYIEHVDRHKEINRKLSNKLGIAENKIYELEKKN